MNYYVTIYEETGNLSYSRKSPINSSCFTSYEEGYEEIDRPLFISFFDSKVDRVVFKGDEYTLRRVWHLYESEEVVYVLQKC